MRSGSTLVAMALLVLLGASPLAAQTVRGTLVEQGSGRPIPGTFVTLLDAAGEQRAGALTDSIGRFLLQAPGAGSYTLRAERIGYSTTLSPPLTLRPGEMREYRMVALAQAISLEGIEATGKKRRCTVRPGAGAQTALLWEEARKALNATALSEEQRLFQVTYVQYERDLHPRTLQVRGESTRSRTGLSSSPFVSAPAENLAEKGYIQVDDEGASFYAPDAEVLLSDTFLDGHCFRTTSGEGNRSGWIGLAFEPLRGRKLPDVSGVLWLDRSTAELRSLEYRYTGLVLEEGMDSVGGHLEFEQLPGGAWIVPRWWIRMPTVKERRVQTRGWRMRKVASIGLKEVGGEVIEVRTLAGVPIFGAFSVRLTGEVFDSTRGVPLRGARVFLEGTPYAVIADSAGRFEMEGLPEGSYSLTFSHPRLDSLGFSPRPRTVTLKADGMSPIALAIPSPVAIWAAECPDSVRAPGTGVLVGLVRNTASGVPLPEARVSLKWPGGGAETTTSSAGRFRFCAVPEGAAVRAEAGFLGSRSAPSEIRITGNIPSRHDLALEWRGPLGTARQPVRVTGRLLDAETSRPLSGATVRLANTRFDGTTDSDGAFALAKVPPDRTRWRWSTRGMARTRKRWPWEEGR